MFSSTEILRFAQNDRKGAQDDKGTRVEVSG